MEQFNIQIKRTARYFLKGNLTPTTTQIWLVLHGYGQLADDFLNSLTAFDATNEVVIAPEALSKFYVKGISGKTGASWMTRSERESEIADYINYLESVTQKIQETSTKKITWNILGFSQGVPTLCRWLTETSMNIDKIVLCSGIFPEDLSIQFLSKNGAFSGYKTHLCYGKNDKLIVPEQMQQLSSLAQDLEHLRIWEFEGRHEINNVLLKKIIAL